MGFLDKARAAANDLAAKADTALASSGLDARGEIRSFALHTATPGTVPPPRPGAASTTPAPPAPGATQAATAPPPPPPSWASKDSDPS